MRSILAGSVLALLVLALWNTSLLSDPPEKPAEKADPYAVPDGSAQELVEYLIKLAKVKPANAEEGAKMRAALIKAADGILAADPDERQLSLAISAKSQALGNDLGKLARFAAELQKDGRGKFAREVRGFALLQKIQLVPLTRDNIRARATEIVDFLAEAPVNAGMDAALCQYAGRMAEVSGDEKFAAQTYRRLQEIFSKSADPRAAQIGKMMEGTVRRLELPGNTMTIEGNVLGGGPFNWSNYEGKVVAVDFFATWCGPCWKEIENLKMVYKKYHAKGFDVVGISLDRDLGTLEKFIKDKELPWSVVYGDKRPSPTPTYYGVTAIPQMILVGKDGKVITLNARGDRLVRELERLLGPVEEGSAGGAKG
ncbi:MAG: TlpA family protein disulfide reductase [Pirellulales bacterium]|nr:TlpA family protein disulfide reductase [Pirellulales bacterium]